MSVEPTAVQWRTDAHLKALQICGASFEIIQKGVCHGLGHAQSLLRLVELAGRLDYAAGSHLARFGQGSPGFAQCRRT